ncbi:ribonuclease P protein subunit p40-like [Choristoneura fumiferana]|uniref:ribonuclease P protein subunit p40-like n=1 Tax=Choristoneura fumiferana TaxID=7141 RepID=UPI003D15C04E
MLCPEVFNFPCPKVVSSSKNYENCEAAMKTIKMNYFYKSLIVTCPDEMHVPNFIEEMITEDTDYYKITKCSVTEFIDVNFIDNFVKKGKLYCITADKNCVVQNCAAVTPDGVLTLHILDFVFQTLGLEGKKQPHNYFEIRIDLKNLRHTDKLYSNLCKLETFNFFVYWEPNNEDVCPSSIAKYFYDKNVNVTVCPIKLKHLSPEIEEVPALEDVDSDEMTEWIGMLAHNADLNPTENYISSYSQPESEHALKTTRIALLISNGMFTPYHLERICKKIEEYVANRELNNFWACVSIQSFENSLWQWGPSSPRMFQAHDSTCNLFFSHAGIIEYSIGQIKYS